MHPAVVLVPALALVFGPRWWVNKVLEEHNRRDLAGAVTARQLARELLDKTAQRGVRVERTDVGDHYDPIAKAVRLGGDKIDRRTLTALTTAAHEVAHALQDAARYRPFVWRTRLVRVARYAGDAGAVLFLAMPLSVAFFRHPLPPAAIGAAALAILGSGVVANLAALPSELDASFARALPLLREGGYVNEQQAQDARKILWACSLSYIASSLIAVLHVWPWVGPSRLGMFMGPRRASSRGSPPLRSARARALEYRTGSGPCGPVRPHRRRRGAVLETLMRPIARPLIRLWLQTIESV